MEFFIIAYIIILLVEIFIAFMKKKSNKVQFWDFFTPTFLGFSLITASIQITDLSRADITKILVIYEILYLAYYFVINLISAYKKDADK